jgi:hypothetical protein
MKKISKLILGVVAVSLVVVGAQIAIKNYLQGPARPFNSILVSGNKESSNKAKEIYKDNTEYTKDYKYKTVTNIEKRVDENKKEQTYENKHLIITKSTAKEMLKDKVLRKKKDKDASNGSLETVLLESIPNINTEKSIYFGYPNEDEKLEINNKNIPLEYGSYSWIGYYPSNEGSLIITDDNTYKSIENEEKVISLIKFKKGTKDLRDSKDKIEVNKNLAKIQNIEINYANIKN